MSTLTREVVHTQRVAEIKRFQHMCEVLPEKSERASFKIFRFTVSTLVTFRVDLIVSKEELSWLTT